MSGESSVGESVSFAEHETLKAKHAALLREHEASLETIKLLEEKLREAVVVKEDVEGCEKKSSELLKKLDALEKEIKDMMYSEVASEDSPLGEDDHKVVIVLSDDDEGNRSESSGGESDSEDEENFSFYL